MVDESHRVSAGLLMYRIRNGQLEVFLAHPGGPFFLRKDNDHWSLPKGEVLGQESLLETARREFKEEIGLDPGPPYLELGQIQQKGGKWVHAWAFAGDWEETRPIQSNTFVMEWPSGSGQRQAFPEVDRASFFTLNQARIKLKAAQHPFLDRLVALLGYTGPG
jgi:predicted NUDIX family NTP pyrophosphohydrolase